MGEKVALNVMCNIQSRVQIEVEDLSIDPTKLIFIDLVIYRDILFTRNKLILLYMCFYNYN